MNEKKKIRESAALGSSEGAERARRNWRIMSRNAVKMGDRRIALCALANSAGQPTQRLITGCVWNWISLRLRSRDPVRMLELHGAFAAPGLRRLTRDNIRRGRVGAVIQLLSTG